jgi:hypothetical protein
MKTTGLVEAQADGVHLSVNNESNSLAGLDVKGNMGLSLQPGDNSFTLTLAPGSYEIACMNSAVTSPLEYVPLQVVDPNAFWTPIELSCSKRSSYTNEDGPVVSIADPTSGASDIFGNYMREGDTADRGGYPQDSSNTFVVLHRDGAIQGVASLKAMAGEWHVSTVSECSG